MQIIHRLRRVLVLNKNRAIVWDTFGPARCEVEQLGLGGSPELLVLRELLLIRFHRYGTSRINSIFCSTRRGFKSSLSPITRRSRALRLKRTCCPTSWMAMVTWRMPFPLTTSMRC